MIADLLFRLRAILRRRAVEEELASELQFHLECEAEKLTRAGLDPSESARRARLALGGMEPVKEECRQARGVAVLETAVQDLRHTLRGMRRSPAFTIAAVITLGLGAAAVSTVFTLANTLFLRELPVDKPAGLVSVQPTRRHGRIRGWASYPDYVHFRDATQTLAGLAAHYSTAPLFAAANGHVQQVNGAVVSANFFPLLGVQPALGRFFRPDEDRVPDRDRVAVLGYDLWRNWFGASTDALGMRLKINGTFFRIIGVAPKSFRGVTVQPDEIYIPTMMAGAGYRWCKDALASDCTVFDMLGRLRDGVTVEQARAEMTTLMPFAWANAPEGENSGITVLPARGVEHPDLVPRSELRFIELLAAVAGVLLLVCCVNLAGLLIARNSARVREFAIRSSLGAGSMRLMRQLITEALVLAASGGALGMLLSLALTSRLNSMFYSVDVEGDPLYYDFNPEWRVILAVAAVAILAGLLVGIVPAMAAVRGNAGERIKQRSAAASLPLGRWVAGAQAGIAVALAVVAGLLVTSAQSMIAGKNYDASRVALMRLRPRLIDYPPAKAQRFIRTAIERLEMIPGVESASMVGNGAVLLGQSARVSLPGWAAAHALECGYIEIGPRYFETLRTPVLRGREFDLHDTVGSRPVAIVSDALARRLWPSGDVAGATVMVYGQPHQVVGVAGDALLQPRGMPQAPYLYVPFWQNPTEIDARVCVRVKGDPDAALPVLTRAVNRVDPDVPIAETMTLPLQMAGRIQPERTTATFASYAAVLAVLLSAVGLYGALAFSVARRKREIGIRMAIGARPAEVLLMVMREGMTVISVGVTAGVGLAIAATRVIRHLLYGSGAADAWTYAAAVLVMIAAGLLACWIPARRAASIEPLAALRED